ncbi:MAG TPA: hypothetical protein VFY65_04870, partial [Longimicrobium sp.]|nr:hypothetical protein [Longimicrobium sp.]
MHRTRCLRARNPILLLLLALAACDGGESAGIARPEQMELTIVSGRGMVLTVRDPALPADDPGHSDPVVARVSLALEATEKGEVDATGPGRLRLPPVEIHWRMLEPWCTAAHDVTPVHGDTASNFYIRPTRTVTCNLVAEGVAEGRVFDADTAAVIFNAGPAVDFQPAGLVLLVVYGDFPFRALPRGPLDFYGNPVRGTPAYTATLVTGPPVITVQDDTLLVAGGDEGSGNVRVTVGARTADIPVWVIRPMETHQWSMSWRCYGMELPDGAYADSAYYRYDTDRIQTGSFSEQGLHVGMRGTLWTRTWVRGEGMRETFDVTSRYVSQRPNEMVWHNGERAAATGVSLRYDGGNLCDAPPG